MSQYVTELDVSLNKHEEDQLTEQGFIKINVDLNKGVHGNRIYLWYKKGPKVGLRITRIQVSFTDEMNQGLNEAGFEKIDKNLNAGAGGDHIYLWFSRGYSAYYIPIVDLDVTTDTTEEGQLFKAGWERLACDLNRKAKGSWIYLWLKRDKPTYICDIDATDDFGADADKFQNGYIRVDENTNKDAGGKKVFLWYRQTTNTQRVITDLQISINDDEYNSYKSQQYELVEVDLNERTGGNPVYLWYKRGDPSDPSDPIKGMTVITNPNDVEPFENAGVQIIKKSLNTGNKGPDEYVGYCI